MKTTRRLFTAIVLLAMIGLRAAPAHAWCNPDPLYCGDVISANLHSGNTHDDINTYNCTGSTQYNGNAHVYRIYPPTSGPLWITLEWTPTSDPLADLHLFILYDCNRNHCIAQDDDYVYIANADAGNDYWVIIDGRGNAADAQSYVLRAYCGDTPLAAELQTFDATPAAESIVLSWSVASETDNDHFTVERRASSDLNWQAIARVEGRGNATSGANYRHEDRDVAAGNMYYYRLSSVGADGSSDELAMASAAFGRTEEEIAEDFQLLGNYPNPFNPSTTIQYQNAVGADLRLDVFTVDGRFVQTLVSGFVEAGFHEVSFDAAALGTGVYFARLSGTSGSQMMKMMLMK